VPGSIGAERGAEQASARPTLIVERGDGPDFVVQSETEAGDDEIKIGIAWKRTTSKGKSYLLVKLDRPTLWNGAHCALIAQQDGSFGLVWKRTKLKAEEAAEAAQWPQP